MRSGNGLALLLIALGGLIILSKLGVGLGFLFGLLIPILIIALGVMAWTNGNRLVGGIIALFGAIMLLGKLSFLFVWAAAIGMVLIGISMLTKRPRAGRRF